MAHEIDSKIPTGPCASCKTPVNCNRMGCLLVTLGKDAERQFELRKEHPVAPKPGQESEASTPASSEEAETQALQAKAVASGTRLLDHLDSLIDEFEKDPEASDAPLRIQSEHTSPSDWFIPAPGEVLTVDEADAGPEPSTGGPNRPELRPFPDGVLPEDQRDFLVNGMDSRLKLGCTAKDLMNGVEGLVTHIVEFFNGGLHMIIQTKATESGEQGLMWSVDIQSLDYVDEGISARCTPPKPGAGCDIELGMKVVDEMSGFKGMVNKRIISINGCVSYEVISRAKKGAKKALLSQITSQSKEIAAERLTILDDGIMLRSQEVRGKNASDEKGPPGPATVVTRAQPYKPSY